ncbi:MAG TPA: PLP-dependent aminotransferase family protein, partial [Puia sp.]|nr:PLP-dependent aminotransferase family protein [Puia sp.]
MPRESLEISLAGIQLSKESVTPLYIQLYQQIRQSILNGQLRRGDRIPASRNLAKKLEVSRVIVNQAYEQLILEGYILGKTGSGTFVSDQVPDHLLLAGAKSGEKNPNDRSHSEGSIQSNLFAQSNLVPFQIGTPSLDQFPYKAWQSIGVKVLKDLKKHHLGYDDGLGHWELREQIASYLRIARAVRCDTEQVIVLTGAQQGLNIITRAILERGDKVWMEDPGYFGAKNAFEEAGAKICHVPMEKDGLDIRFGKMKFPDAKMIYVTPSNQFPLGYTLTHAKRLELLSWASENKVWILEDDYDSEFRYEGNPLPSLQGLDKSERVIYIGTFSKVLFPGLRLAYIVVPNVSLVPLFKEIKLTTDRQSPILEQLILTRFMQDGGFLRHIRKMRLLYAERQKILRQLIEEYLSGYLSIEYLPSGMHLLCWLSERIDVTIFRDEARKQKLSIFFIQTSTKRN